MVRPVSFNHSRRNDARTVSSADVNALLNSSGGTIYFGITDDGEVVGVNLTKKNRDTIGLNLDATMEQ